MHYKNYINNTKSFGNNEIAKAVENTVSNIIPEHIETFNFLEHQSGLLLGNVQSGKTGHMLGVISSAADNEFDLFIVLTTDSTHLQKQTLERCLQYLDTFCVCDEQDDMRFLTNDMRKPVVIVLKKNTRVLETWKNLLISSGYLNGRPVFIVDDESDAASLNTKVNKDEVSTINGKINDIRKLANSSFYLQVTATPQSLFLQEKDSDFRPRFVHYFKPGSSYLGGNFFYKTAKPYSENQIPFPIRITNETELNDLRDKENVIPQGMYKALTCFLVCASHILKNKTRSSCNFLIHPSVSIADHETIAEKIGEALNLILFNYDEDDLNKLLKESWLDLQKTKPDLLDFQECFSFIKELLDAEKITISTMNSKSSADINFNEGANIVVGGNSLGRGVTFPNLQVTYYCRKSKSPQADTFWQHCRTFGYDRDPNLTRVFLPGSLFKLFSELNNSNNAMINYVVENGIDGLRLIYPKGVNPTRKNVVNKKRLEIIAGGVNHFASFPTTNNFKDTSTALEIYDEKDDFHIVDINLVKKLILLQESEYKMDWPAETYSKCIDSLENNNLEKPILIVRRDRNISKNTGTLLSPNDRKIGDQFKDRLVLTLYNILGTADKGWDSHPVWIPNIKFPSDKFFYNIED